jgi:hypothetical protein
MACRRKLMRTLREGERLLLLVGSNPLPNYLAAVALKARKVIALHSPETAEPSKRLKEELERRSIAVETLAIDDATDARKVAAEVRKARPDHVHYSGGTKTMAAHALRAAGLQESQASYLDERKGWLRFDNGVHVPLDKCNLGLTLDVVLRLHGIKRLPTSEAVAGGPTEGDVDALGRGVLSEPKLASELYERLRPKGKRLSIKDAKEKPFEPGRHGLVLSVARIPASDWDKRRYETWDDFLCGGWLERWTAEMIRQCLGKDAPSPEVGVVCKREAPRSGQFEIDVALLRGHRLYVLSCTTARKKALCKAKLFEVAMRSRQMGGDLARSALVCLLDKGPQGEDYVEELRADIAGLWDAPNVPQVFGLADLREWEGASGDRNLSTLNGWLDS